YNSALSFTSIDIKIDNQITGTSGVYTFHIHGKMYYKIGTLLSDSEIQLQFTQMYIYDIDNKLQNRLNVLPDLDASILLELQQML
ncbi:hypothetical protein C1645_668178, partial [Glomus cerebriforme]